MSTKPVYRARLLLPRDRGEVMSHITALRRRLRPRWYDDIWFYLPSILWPRRFMMRLWMEGRRAVRLLREQEEEAQARGSRQEPRGRVP